MLSIAGPSAQVSIVPVAVGHGVAADGSLPRFDLTEAELKQLGLGLYGLLAQFEGYLTAMVGWDPESFLDVNDLATDWSQELADGTLTGLVLADHLRSQLSLGPAWIPFRPGYLWLPYAPLAGPRSPAPVAARGQRGHLHEVLEAHHREMRTPTVTTPSELRARAAELEQRVPPLTAGPRTDDEQMWLEKAAALRAEADRAEGDTFAGHHEHCYVREGEHCSCGYLPGSRTTEKGHRP